MPTGNDLPPIHRPSQHMLASPYREVKHYHPTLEFPLHLSRKFPSLPSPALPTLTKSNLRSIEVEMVVYTGARTRGGLGLRITNSQVQEFFPPEALTIELELDHLRILCPLDASFWQDRPEIHDLRLSSWLETKRSTGKLANSGGQLTMVPCGNNTFRLLPVLPDPPSPNSFPATWLS